MWAALHSTSSGLMGALPTLAVLCAIQRTATGRKCEEIVNC